MASDTGVMNKWKVQDRVKRVNNVGCSGVVKEIKIDVMGAADSKDKGIMIGVLWDNGTLSFIAPHCLELSK
jgi:hypothetical protein